MPTDNAGNASALAGRTMKYDVENRLVSVTGGTVVQSMVYDGDGRRVVRMADTMKVIYVYTASGELALEKTSGGGVASEGGRRYVFADHLGSTRGLVDTAGAAKGWWDYSPFGEEVPKGSARNGVAYYGGGNTQSVAFTGHVRDRLGDGVLTGLDYFGARHFHAGQGRFTSADPKMLPDAVYDPQSWNKYGYVRNNPLRHIDPDGEDWRDAADFAWGVARGIASSVSMGYAGAPRSTDSVASLTGQGLGSVIAADAGGKSIAGGTGLAIATSPTGVGAAAGVGIAVAGAVTVAGAAKNSATVVVMLAQKAGSYAPVDDQGNKTPLPLDKRTGKPIPETNADGSTAGPHTQLGTKKSSNEGVGTYTQGREFDASGKRVKDIHFTDHGRPKNHSNPHQHRIDPQTGKVLPAERLQP